MELTSDSQVEVPQFSNGRCLICDQQITNPTTIIIKRELEPDFPVDHGYEMQCNNEDEDLLTSINATTGLETLCKLLSLSSPLKARVTRHNQLSTMKFPFCSTCNGMIKDASELFSQIQYLEISVQKLKGQVHAMINSADDRHVKQYQESDQEGGQIPKGTNHKCKANCDHIDKIRRLIVAGDQSRKRKNLHSLDTVKRSDEKVNTLDALKQFSVKIVPLMEEEIKAKMTKIRTNNLNLLSHEETFNDDINIEPDIVGTFTDLADDDLEIQHNDADEAEVILGLDKPCELLAKEDFTSSQNPILKVEKVKIKQERPGGTRSRRRRRKLEGSVACPECDKVFRSDYLQQRHLANWHAPDLSVCPFACSICGRRYALEIQLQRHLSNQDGACKKTPLNKDCVIITGNGDKRFMCKICNHTTKSRSIFERHYVKHTKIKRFTCEICGASFSARASVLAHKLRMHYEGPLEEHPFHCSFEGCHKLLGTRVQLVAHEKEHLGQLDFMCSKCDFRAVSLGRLNKHYDVHAEVGRYKCQKCPKVFRSCSKLHCHVRQQHTKPEDRPYRCQACGKTFCSKDRLDRHTIVHTNEKPIACEICDKRFAVRDYLIIHMKVHRKRGEIIPVIPT